ncbi:MAG: Hint domain-containing protein [Paracoccus sp. (in: a-proteobacteria)]
MATYTGNNNNNNHAGSAGDDTLAGNFGNDTLTGLGGDDLIYGENHINPLSAKGSNTGPTSTQVYVNNSADTVYIYAASNNGSITKLFSLGPGETRNETVNQDAGRVIGNVDGTEYYSVAKNPGQAGSTTTINTVRDSLNGGAGNDTIYGQLGNDILLGDIGHDVLEGGTGNDTINGGGDNDKIGGGDGDDSIVGGVGNDTIAGGNGADIIDGGIGLDSINGGSGNDSISSGSDSDYVSGDGGDDTISSDAGSDTLIGGIGNDSITGGTEDDSIDGGSGNDTLWGGTQDDTISGGAGNDSILGGADQDSLAGNSGNDTIDGGAGNDAIEGGVGTDSLLGGIGDDTIYGDSMTEAPPDVVYSAGTTTTNNTLMTNLDTGTTISPGTWTTTTIDGIPYIVSTARSYDGYLDIHRLNDDGTLTKTDWMRYQNSGPTVTTGSDGNISTAVPTGTFNAFGNSLSSTQVVDVNGINTLFVTSQNGSGLTAWQMNSGGTIDLIDAVSFGSSQSQQDGGITRDFEFIPGDNGNVYIYASRGQNDYISQLEYNPTTGKITEGTGPNVATPEQPNGMTALTVDGTKYLAVSNETGLQLFEVNTANGNLTAVSSAQATEFGNPSADVDVYTKPDGTVYLTYSNQASNEVALFRVGTGGSLTQTDSLIDQGDYAYQDTQVSYINGEPVIVVPDISEDVTRIYSISDDGAFSLELEIPGIASGVPSMIVQSEDGTHHLVDPRSGTTVELILTEQPGEMGDFIDGGEGADHLLGQFGDDTILGQGGSDKLDGGDGNDSLDGGANADEYTGGEGFDTFIAGNGDTITDFNTAAGQNINDGNQANNDFVDLSAYYNDANLTIYNTAHGTDYSNPLKWMRADQADGVLDMLDGTNGLPTLNMEILNGGTAVASADLTTDNTRVVCFSADALITTPDGEVAAGYLSVGDLVETVDAGSQPIRWIGMRTLNTTELAANPKLRPIRIQAGALGNGLPEADLIVSPQHRMLVRSKIAQKMFGTNEVLVAAKQLCQIEGIDVAEDLDEVTYVHFLFDTHQIVIANGAESESLFPGAEALKSVGPEAIAEIHALFPELDSPSYVPVAARELVSGRLGRKLAIRHLQNNKALVM